jgi:predicted metal-dependent peptidase
MSTLAATLRNSANGNGSAQSEPKRRPKPLPVLSPEQREQVGQRVLRARIRLSLQQPFLATALMRLPLREVDGASWCPTAATDGYHIFYNPRWIHTLRDGELRGLLAHEVLHVLFTHADRRGRRHAWVWNVACDYAINLLLVQRGFKLPKGGLFSEDAQGKTAEQIYKELEAHLKKIGLPQSGDGVGDGKGDGQGGRPELRLPGPMRVRPQPPDSAGDGQGEDDLQRDRIPEAGDDLLDPDDPRVRPLRSPDAPDRERLEELRRELRADALARLQGDEGVLFRQECQADERRRVDWRALLRTWLSDRIKGDWCSFPFSKRHLHRGLFMPSPGMQVPGHVVFAIDTSGSMSIEVLGAIAAELRAFREVFPCRLSVVQCDTAVRHVQEFEAMDGYEIPKNFTLQGRGGTDFRPLFAWVGQQAEGALVLFATDGYGTFPEKAPAAPVIWLLTPGHADEEKFPFGVGVELNENP